MQGNLEGKFERDGLNNIQSNVTIEQYCLGYLKRNMKTVLRSGCLNE